MQTKRFTSIYKAIRRRDARAALGLPPSRHLEAAIAQLRYDERHGSRRRDSPVGVGTSTTRSV
jgi:hypothetical protein